MKTALFVIGHLALFVVFIVVFFGGSLLDPFHMKWFISHPTLTSSRYFVPDGLILMVLLYIVIVGVEAAAKKLRTAGLWTTVTFAIALVVGLLAKFGMLTHDLL